MGHGGRTVAFDIRSLQFESWTEPKTVQMVLALSDAEELEVTLKLKITNFPNPSICARFIQAAQLVEIFQGNQ